MGFTYERNIHFADTDAAGVVFFARYLALAHEAYEESLARAGIRLQSVFADQGTLIPIRRCAADYLRPLLCGDRVAVALSARLISDDTFAVDYEVTRLDTRCKVAARISTEHVCITAATRERTPLPAAFRSWIAATSSPAAPAI